MSIILHIYPTTIENESRIFRATRSISTYFKECEIHICGLYKEGLKKEEISPEGYSIYRFKIKNRGIRGFKSFFFKRDWKKKIYEKYKNEKLKIIHCHSLLDLSVGVLLKRNHPGSFLIYDAHELETEKNGLKGIKKLFEKIREKHLIQFVDETIVVNESIAAWYKRTYPGLQPKVVKNISGVKTGKKRAVDLRSKFNVPEKSLLFIYVGYLHHGRGLEHLLNAFSTGGLNDHVLFVGYGELEQIIKQHESRYNNVHFHEKVTEVDVVSFASSADIGLSLIENTCLSYYYCLPNKIYEYLHAGIPIIASDFPEMSKVIKLYNAGWTSKPDSASIIKIIKSLTKEDVESRKKRLAGQIFENWENEEKILIEIYTKLILP